MIFVAYFSNEFSFFSKILFSEIDSEFFLANCGASDVRLPPLRYATDAPENYGTARVVIILIDSKTFVGCKIVCFLLEYTVCG